MCEGIQRVADTQSMHSRYMMAHPWAVREFNAAPWAISN
jgi:hypothetical protein